MLHAIVDDAFLSAHAGKINLRESQGRTKGDKGIYTTELPKIGLNN